MSQESTKSKLLLKRNVKVCEKLAVMLNLQVK